MTSQQTQRTDPPLATDEVTTLRALLAYHRATLRMKTDGLDQQQLAALRPPSMLALGGLLKHAAFNDDWEFHSAADDSPGELRRIFDEAAAGADAAIDGQVGE